MSARTLKGEALAGILGGGINLKHGDNVRATAQLSPSFTFGNLNLRFSISLVYEDGDQGDLEIELIALTNDRAAVSASKINQDLRNATIKAASVTVTGGGTGGGNPVRQRGQLFAALFLDRADAEVSQLFGGYTYEGHHPTLGIVENWRDGPGAMFTSAGTDQVAGVEVGDTVPAGAMWRIYAIEVVLVTDGTVANRFVNLLIDDAATTITRRLFLTSQTAQTATLTRTHHWSPGTDANNTAEITQVDTITLLAKFPMSLQNGVGPLDAGYNIRTLTSATVNGAPGMLAGDNYGAPRYLVEEWLKRRT